MKVHFVLTQESGVPVIEKKEKFRQKHFKTTNWIVKKWGDYCGTKFSGNKWSAISAVNHVIMLVFSFLFSRSLAVTIMVAIQTSQGFAPIQVDSQRQQELGKTKRKQETYHRSWSWTSNFGMGNRNLILKSRACTKKMFEKQI